MVKLSTPDAEGVSIQDRFDSHERKEKHLANGPEDGGRQLVYYVNSMVNRVKVTHNTSVFCMPKREVWLWIPSTRWKALRFLWRVSWKTEKEP